MVWSLISKNYIFEQKLINKLAVTALRDKSFFIGLLETMESHFSFVNIDKLTPGILETNVSADVRQSNRYKFIKGTIRDPTLLVSVLSDYEVH